MTNAQADRIGAKPPSICEDSSQKRQQGRPSLWGDRLSWLSAASLAGTESPRVLQNCFHAAVARNTLRDQTGVEWLIEGRRESLLAEIGRLDDPEAIKAAALEICEMRPTVRSGIAILRAARLGTRREPGTVGGLAAVIARAIDTYAARHPAPRAAMLDALRIVAGAIEAEEVEQEPLP